MPRDLITPRKIVLLLDHAALHSLELHVAIRVNPEEVRHARTNHYKSGGD